MISELNEPDKLNYGDAKMTDSRFWRTLGVVLVAGVFYFAHGLHDPAGDSMSGLFPEVHAGDVATVVPNSISMVKIITSTDDGRTINIWTASTSNSRVSFLGSFTAQRPKPQAD
jgi:hypothetical protein